MSIEVLELLLLVAVIVAVLARRVRLPYTVALVVAGLLIAVLGLGNGVQLSKELIYKALLPPLIFEAAYQMPWPEVRRDLPVTAFMATGGVLISTVITAGLMHLLTGLEWLPAIAFGLLISATDPVSVLATFRELKVEGRLRVLIESESLFNDGTVAALFAVVAGATSLETLSAGQVGIGFIVTVLGGLAVGLLVGWAAHFLLRPADDHLIEVMVTVVAAFGSFLLAEHFHFTGVLSTVAAGLILRKFGDRGSLSDQGQSTVITFWEFMAFAANSLVFLLIGVELAGQEPGALLSVLAAIPVVLIGRAAAVYGCAAAFIPTDLRIKIGRQHALFWGGLRGALALALALGLPSEFPQRQLVLAASFAVVAFSVIVQGMTIKSLLRRIGELPAE
jgi:CPA1 family monovalent cation:H+ antiporter